MFSVLVRQGLCVCGVKSLCISGLQRRVFSFSGPMCMCLKDLQRFCRLYIGRGPGEFHYTNGVMCRGPSKLAFQPGGDWGVSQSACSRLSAGYGFRYPAAEGAHGTERATRGSGAPAH